MRLTILHTNDFHGALTPEMAARIRVLKEASQPCLYFDSGDCIKAGNLAIPFRPEPAWGLLAEAGCDASTLGNRETHVLESAFKAKLAGARHPILVSNLRLKSGERPFPASMVFEIAGLRVGVIGAMAPMVTERMKTAFASAYLWDPPVECVIAEAEELGEGTEGQRDGGTEGQEDGDWEKRRNGETGGFTIDDLRFMKPDGGMLDSETPPVTRRATLDLRPVASIRKSQIVNRKSSDLRPASCDLLIALTHIGIREDRKLAEACPSLDLIFGGHSHTVLEHPERIGSTWICQGGSHGRNVGKYVWDSSEGLTDSRLLPQ